MRDPSWFGVALDHKLETRWEEYDFVRGELAKRQPGWLMDAGCGTVPGVHVMPEIAASLGWRVDAIDTAGSWSRFASHPLIDRGVVDMCDTGYPAGSFNAYLSVSVLEHLTLHDQVRALREADRVLKPGGLLVLTMDENGPTPRLWPTLAPSGYEVGEPMTPAPLKTCDNTYVSFVTVTKP